MLEDIRAARQFIHKEDGQIVLISPKVVYVPLSRFLELAAEGYIERSGKWTGKATAKLRAEVPTCEWVGQIAKEKAAEEKSDGWW